MFVLKKKKRNYRSNALLSNVHHSFVDADANRNVKSCTAANGLIASQTSTDGGSSAHEKKIGRIHHLSDFWSHLDLTPRRILRMMQLIVERCVPNRPWVMLVGVVCRRAPERLQTSSENTEAWIQISQKAVEAVLWGVERRKRPLCKPKKESKNSARGLSNNLIAQLTQMILQVWMCFSWRWKRELIGSGSCRRRPTCSPQC